MLLVKCELIVTQLIFPSKNVFCNLMSFQWQNHSKFNFICAWNFQFQFTFIECYSLKTFGQYQKCTQIPLEILVFI